MSRGKCALPAVMDDLVIFLEARTGDVLQKLSIAVTFFAECCVRSWDGMSTSRRATQKPSCSLRRKFAPWRVSFVQVDAVWVPHGNFTSLVPLSRPTAPSSQSGRMGRRVLLRQPLR